MSNLKSIYLDYNATTPLDPRVLEIMMPFFRENFGNPASQQHAWGWTAERAVEKARAQVAQLLGAKSSEITFTSGATEGNNWVLQSLFDDWKTSGDGRGFHILSSPVEHSSVMKSLDYLSRRGAEVEFVPVNSYAQVSVAEVARRLRPETRVLSFIWANNEVGSLNPIAELGELAHKNKVYLHSDATQAVGKIPVDLGTTKVDFLTLSAHKIYGPKGAGALYMRSREPQVEMSPLIYGGGQEKGRRSGTVNVPAVVGLGAACEICLDELRRGDDSVKKLKDNFLRDLFRELPSARLNGDPENRVHANMSLTFRGFRLEDALGSLMRLGFSTGSACHSASATSSYVLQAMGFSKDEIDATLRLSLGRFTTAEELSVALGLLKTAFSQKLA